jgi:hypothetical protein
LSACGQKDVAAASPTESPAAIKAPMGAGPAMWVVEDEDSTIYLFGTFHILPSTMRWTTPAFDAAMRETPATMTEVDTASPEAQAKLSALVAELGLNPPGVTLSSLLGKERAARFAKIAERHGAPMASLEPLKPWLAMISLSIAVMQKEGFSADSGAEQTILARAGREGDSVTHLETPDFQIRALASLDERELLADLDESLDQFEDFDAYAKRVLDAWRKGDVDAIDFETVAPMRKGAPGAYKTLIADRNADWVRQIEALMEGSDDVFIAVGAGHLVGEGSVVDMLEENGRDVRRVQ